MKTKIYYLLLVPAILLASCNMGNNQEHQKYIEEIKMNKETAHKNKRSVKAFFKALEDENVDDLVALFAEDVQHINAYASGLFPEGASGREEIRKYWEPVFPSFDGMTFPIEEIYAMEDPNIVFVKYIGKIKLKDGAGYYENNYYSTFTFNEAGLITEYVEIFNPVYAIEFRCERLKCKEIKDLDEEA